MRASKFTAAQSVQLPIGGRLDFDLPLARVAVTWKRATLVGCENLGVGMHEMHDAEEMMGQR